jgi:hypothetical protein
MDTFILHKAFHPYLEERGEEVFVWWMGKSIE